MYEVIILCFMAIFYFFGGLFVGLLFGWVVYVFVARSWRERFSVLEIALRDRDVQVLREREVFESIKSSFRLEFEGLAADVLEKKAENFARSNNEQVSALLAPLDKSIKDFKDRLESTHTTQTTQCASLDAQIRQLVANTNQVSEQANNLASALKGDNKKIGDWGEMILQTILERSGLREGEQYRMQVSLDCGLRPDAVVYLPEGRNVILDSKVSMVAYERYCSSDSEGEQNSALSEHLSSLRSHIKGLSDKSYDDMVDSVDFVMMFVPVEPAYILAMQKDSDLWEYAYKRRVLLISPTNLIASLKLINDLWRREKQSQNAQNIVSQAERMYEKFVGLTESMSALGRSIGNTQAMYDKALGQFCEGRGNLLNQAQRLHDLGLKSSKRPFLESDTDLD